jgi:hypothetical protein
MFLACTLLADSLLGGRLFCLSGMVITQRICAVQCVTPIFGPKSSGLVMAFGLAESAGLVLLRRP